MAPRNTRTGGVLESMVLPALTQGGYTYTKQQILGKRLGVGKHKVDVLAQSANGQQFPISLKWQQTSGTAEQKVPFELICLLETLEDNPSIYERAYLVLGGEGWTLRDKYVSGALEKYIAYKNKVFIMTLEAFIAKANRGQL